MTRREQRRSPVRTVACAFFLFHIAAISIANVPETTALGSAFHAPFETYVRVAGLWQSWDMFTTIPYYLDLDAELVALVDGREVRFGPMLPGLSRYRKELRVHGFFLRITEPGGEWSHYSNAYFRAACRAVSTRTGVEPTRIGLDLLAGRIRPLADVRRDHRIAQIERRGFEGPRCR